MINSNFNLAIERLNKQQLEAVETIDGTVIINAGPGTGKTTVLSLRIGNILQKVDIDPRNILCLTFTDAAAKNMREKLSSYIGPTAFKVNISTFHSFCTEIIGTYPEYFFNGFRFSPIDQITQFQILDKIISTLPLGHKLASYHPTIGYTFLPTLKTYIGNLKKEGITSLEFKKFLQINESFLMKINKSICDLVCKLNNISSRNKDWLNKYQDIILQIVELLSENKVNIDDYLEHFTKTKAEYLFQNNISIFYFELFQNTLKKCIEDNKSTPFSNLKSECFCKLDNDALILSELKNIETMKEVADFYSLYEQEMYLKGYFDFSDMILEVIKVLTSDKGLELKFQLQEKYQYILVDEYQDTNGSQLQLIELLINQEQNSPNLLVVGDTDQTIYKFQGALLGNLEGFQRKFPEAKVINLFQNYRSNPVILEFAEEIIKQSQIRDHDSKTKLVSGFC
jgi:DNA helicase II / ATP-dependent DNA helicase PcrA